LFPISYSIITLCELLNGYFAIKGGSDSELYYILEGICYVIISSRGGIIACVFLNLMRTSK